MRLTHLLIALLFTLLNSCSSKAATPQFSIDVLADRIASEFAKIIRNFDENDSIYISDSGQEPEIFFTQLTSEFIKEIDTLSTSNINSSFLNQIDSAFRQFAKKITWQRSEIRQKNARSLKRTEWRQLYDNYYKELEKVAPTFYTKSLDNNFNLYEKNINAKNFDLCEFDEFKNAAIVESYKQNAIAFLKAFLMIQYTNIMKKRYSEALIEDVDLKLVNKRFKELRFLNRKEVHKINADNNLWKCDPHRHVLNQTYQELTVFQGIVINEVNLNSDGSCKQDCPSYTFVEKSSKCNRKWEEWCDKRQCEGNIINCKFFNAKMEICTADLSSNRRYENIKFKKSNLGATNYCKSGTTNVESWTRWFVRCNYCLCVCENRNKYGTRYISLKPSISNHQQNRVVTGIKFVERNHMFHIQIQEGKLLPQAEIDKSSVAFKDHQQFNMHSHAYLKQDYYEITNKEKAIGLDEIKIKNSNHVVIGARFKVENVKKREETVILDVLMCGFDFETGILNKSDMFWASYPAKNRKEISIGNTDRPSNSNKLSIKKSSSNQYLKFTYTDYEKDVAQSTVPFFDLQSVVSKKPTPLSGLGIYYKQVAGYGGFLAPSIFAYNYERHIPST